MLGDGKLSISDFKEKDGLPKDFTSEEEGDQTPGASPVWPPVYHVPEPPPQYTRHLSVGEKQL